MTWRPCRSCSQDWHSALVFVLPNGRGDSIRIEIVRLADGFAELVQFVDDRVTALHGVPPDGSSSGVQMTGGVRPAERQVPSMVLRILALARCLQFQVNRYSTW